jgi:hypothetical protein
MELGPMRDPDSLESLDDLDSVARELNPFSPKGARVDRMERPAHVELSIFGYSVESLAYLTALVGIVGDHLSTRIGLISPRIQELNPFTVYLRLNGLWLLFDFFMLVASLGLPALLIRKWSFRGRFTVLAFPILVGSARLFAALHNIMMIVLNF